MAYFDEKLSIPSDRFPTLLSVLDKAVSLAFERVNATTLHAAADRHQALEWAGTLESSDPTKSVVVIFDTWDEDEKGIVLHSAVGVRYHDKITQIDVSTNWRPLPGEWDRAAVLSLIISAREVINKAALLGRTLASEVSPNFQIALLPLRVDISEVPRIAPATAGVIRSALGDLVPLMGKVSHSSHFQKYVGSLENLLESADDETDIFGHPQNV